MEELSHDETEPSRPLPVAPKPADAITSTGMPRPKRPPRPKR